MTSIRTHLIHALLEFERVVHGFESSAPFRRGRRRHLLEGDQSSSKVLVRHEGLRFLALFLGHLLEEGVEAWESHVAAPEVMCLGWEKLGW